MYRNMIVAVLISLSLCNADKEEIFRQAVGPCINDQCMSGHKCYYGQCVPDSVAPAMPSMKPEDAVGPCINGLCPKNTFCQKGECYPL